MNVSLIDDSGSRGGAQNLVVKLKDRINMLEGYQCIIKTSKLIVDSDCKYDIIINCTDWCPDGYKLANRLKLHCEKLYLLSQISFFKPLAALYVDWDHNIWNLREKAKHYYDKVIALSEFQGALWKSAGWDVINAKYINSLLTIEPIKKIVICAAHWNKNKNLDIIRCRVKQLKDLLEVPVEEHSLDENPATPDEMFGPGILYFHSSQTDVNPMTIHEALLRGSLVVVDDFPGSDTLYDNTRYSCLIRYNEFTTDRLNCYYGLPLLETVLTKGDTMIDQSNYTISAKDVMAELKAVMNSYEPKFSDFGYECKPIKKNGAKN